MKLNKKIWVKKVYSVSDSKYVQIYSGDYYATKNARRDTTESEETNTPVYKKAPFWYPGYRYAKSNFVKGLKWLLIFGIAVVLIIFLKHNIGPIKHYIGDMVQSIFKH